ncbi:methyltransferase-domain-containing protein [Phakopsora pachyrhizi]|nr:methyltransferase-domain-containing protein [Phakopsora pachyrhizi]
MRVKNFLFDTPGWSVPSAISDQRQKPKNRSAAKRKRIKNHRSIDDDDDEESERCEKKIHDSSHSNFQDQRIKKTNSIKDKELPKKMPEDGFSRKTDDSLSKSLNDGALVGPRFRMLNESLYTSTGSEAFELFNTRKSSSTEKDLDNQNFEIYHRGFRQQTRSWPQNPIQLIIKQISEDYKKYGSVNVADLGCGEAGLAKSLCKTSKKKKTDGEEDPSKDEARNTCSTKFCVFSYDLVKDSEGWITEAECCNLVPLPGSSSDSSLQQSSMMDCVVCCLSLMGTDWVGMILEARRIVKLVGRLIIAEVISRLVDKEKFEKFIESIGFKLIKSVRPNEYFEIWTFKKVKSQSIFQDIGEKGFDEVKKDLVEKGRKLLKPCIYKKR